MWKQLEQCLAHCKYSTSISHIHCQFSAWHSQDWGWNSSLCWGLHICQESLPPSVALVSLMWLPWCLGGSQTAQCLGEVGGHDFSSLLCSHLLGLYQSNTTLYPHALKVVNEMKSWMEIALLVFTHSFHTTLRLQACVVQTSCIESSSRWGYHGTEKSKGQTCIVLSHSAKYIECLLCAR